MGQNLKLTGAALSVAAAFGGLASGSATAGTPDVLSIPQIVVNPPTGIVSVGLTATGTSPLGSVTVTAGGSVSIRTPFGNPGQVLSGAVGALTGALDGGGGTVMPLAPVQGVVNQVTGTLGSGNPVGALTGALGTATGALGNVGGASSPLAPVQGAVTQLAGTFGDNNPAGALTGALTDTLNTATGTLSSALGTVTGALGSTGGGSNPLAPVQGASIRSSARCRARRAAAARSRRSRTSSTACRMRCRRAATRRPR